MFKLSDRILRFINRPSRQRRRRFPTLSTGPEAVERRIVPSVCISSSTPSNISFQQTFLVAVSQEPTPSDVAIAFTFYRDENLNNTFDGDEVSIPRAGSMRLRRLSDHEVRTATGWLHDVDGNGQFDVQTETIDQFIRVLPEGNWSIESGSPRDFWMRSNFAEVAHEAAYELDQSLNVTLTSNDFLDWGGRQEKWFRGRSRFACSTIESWYFMTPDGIIYRWDDSRADEASGSVVAEVSSAYYDDLTKLVDVEKPEYIDVTINESGVAQPAVVRVGLTPKPVEADYTIEEQTVTFRKPLHVDRFEVWVTDVESRQMIHHQTGIESESIELPLDDGRYRAWVRGESDGFYTDWSPAVHFQPVHPAMQLPTQPLFSARPASEYSWPAVPSATGYEVRQQQIKSGHLRTYPVADASVTLRTSHSDQPTESSVQVRARFADGSVSRWSDTVRWTYLPPPVLTTSESRVSWPSLNEVDGYELDLWANDADQQVFLRVLHFRTTETQLDASALPKGRYTVWVRALRMTNAEPSFLSLWSVPTDLVVH